MSIKLVSETPEEEVARRRAQEAEEEARDVALDALVTMTANLLRIARGSGKPYEVWHYATAYLEAEDELHTLRGRGLSQFEITTALDASAAEREPNEGDEHAYHVHDAKHFAVKGALQLAASRLLGDRLRMAAGESELVYGLNAWEQRPRGRPPRRNGADDAFDVALRLAQEKPEAPRKK